MNADGYAQGSSQALHAKLSATGVGGASQALGGNSFLTVANSQATRTSSSVGLAQLGFALQAALTHCDVENGGGGKKGKMIKDKIVWIQ